MAQIRLLLFVVITFLVSTTYAVSKTAPVSAESNIYALALRASILQMEQEWGHIRYSGENGMPVDYRNMIVEKNPVITDELPTIFEGHSVKYLDTKELVDRYKKLKKSFEILKISPIYNEGNVSKIVISTYWFSYKKNTTMFALSDWSDVEVRYNYGKGGFVITSVKLGGI